MQNITLDGFRCRSHQRGNSAIRSRLVVTGKDGKTYERSFIQSVQEQITVTSWRESSLNLSQGMYCEDCIREAQFDVLEDNLEYIIRKIGDIEPFILVDAKDVNADTLADQIESRFDQSAYRKKIPAVMPQYADWNTVNFHSDLLHTLRTRVLLPNGQLYAFQAEAVASVMAGRDTVITTPTASGKTLAYLLPILDTIIRNPQATALYISPLNALTEDQLDAICRFDESGKDWNLLAQTFHQYHSIRTIKIGTSEVRLGRYDGTVENKSGVVATNPNMILTNPDMLHVGILTNPKKWQHFFSNLKYIVIDEVHTYRGVMGSGMANVVRRLLATCQRNGSQPVLVCASATIANTSHVLQVLTGRKFNVIDGGSSAPQRERTMLVRSAAIEQVENSDGKTPRQSLALVTLARQMLTVLYEQCITTLLFGRSINEISDVQRILKDALQLTAAQQARVQTYRRELPQADKMQILNDMRNGQMHMILATTALSMGIDIGNISAVIIAGFPGSIAEFWQQAGRAGRSGQGLIIYLASVDALNQFFARNPEALFNLRAQPMFLNPDNPYIVERHIITHIAAKNVPMAEIQIFGIHAESILKKLIENGVVTLDKSNRLNLANVNLNLPGFRDVDSASVDAMAGSTKIASVDQGRAIRAFHFGAIYMVQYDYYEVIRTSWQQGMPNGKIQLRRLDSEPDYTTEASVKSTVEPLVAFETNGIANLFQFNRQVKITSQAIGYMKQPIRQRQQKPEYRPLDLSLSPAIMSQSHGLRMTFDYAYFPRTLATKDVVAGQMSFLIALRLAIAIEQLCDIQDIDYAVSSDLSPNTAAELWLFDTASGGIGICEAVWQNPMPVLTRAYAILAECPHCSVNPASRGCVYCAVPRYGDETTINRQVAMVMLEELMEVIKH
jgi:DEAD/DEAH box helicase domain-containing protein